jgi:hypothetical protein
MPKIKLKYTLLGLSLFLLFVAGLGAFAHAYFEKYTVFLQEVEDNPVKAYRELPF